MSILDVINSAIGAAFGNDPNSPFRPGVLFKRVAPASAFGPAPTVDTAGTDCRVFVDQYDRVTRDRLGIPETHVKLMLLQQGGIVVGNGDVVQTIEPISGYWRVSSIEQDPAAATWTMQAEPIGG